MDIYDEALALERAGGDRQLAEQMFAMLRRDLPQQQQDIEKARQAGELARMQQITHRIVGGTRYCGVPGLADSAEVLDRYLKAGHTEQLDLLLKNLNEEIERLLAYTP
ncbi:MAG: Hpt domain-containing protein [Granulosicoccaceae bacterium]|jgi:two-component system sensor histidine kinase BarA